MEVSTGRNLIDEISKVLGLTESSKEIFIEIANKLASKDFDEEFTYNINSVFNEFSFPIDGDIFIVWNQNIIDKINTKTLLENWDYIWYGDSDEAVILYHREKSKLLLITHYGRVFYN